MSALALALSSSFAFAALPVAVLPNVGVRLVEGVTPDAMVASWLVPNQMFGNGESFQMFRVDTGPVFAGVVDLEVHGDETDQELVGGAVNGDWDIQSADRVLDMAVAVRVQLAVPDPTPGFVYGIAHQANRTE